MNIEFPSFFAIQAAHDRIRGCIHKTPVLTSQTINSIFNAAIFFKCENFQKVGAFKFRGASNAVLSLCESEPEKVKHGVATHSSGNHAAALSLAARMRGIQAFIVMPKNSSEAKKKAVAGYGARITFCEPSLEARETTLEKVIRQTGAALIHPYNDNAIICGQATAAKELLEEIPDLDIVMAPVGGGGLLSGTALSVRYISPQTQVIAVEPENADDAFRSLKSGQIIPSVNPNTIADGLRTSLGTVTFAIIRQKVDEIVTVSEEAIVSAMRLIWERMKIIIEPSASVPVAAFMENKIDGAGKRIGIILSGGNVDLDNLPF